MKLTQQDYEEWKSLPIGELFFKMLEVSAQKAKQRWLDESWNGGVCDPKRLASLQARAETFEQLQQVTAEDIEVELDERIRD